MRGVREPSDVLLNPAIGASLQPPLIEADAGIFGGGIDGGAVEVLEERGGTGCGRGGGVTSGGAGGGRGGDEGGAFASFFKFFFVFDFDFDFARLSPQHFSFVYLTQTQGRCITKQRD